MPDNEKVFSLVVRLRDEAAAQARSLTQSIVAGLRDQVAAGNDAAKLDIERLRIAEKFTAERQKLAAISRDTRSDTGQATAHQILGGLDAREQAAQLAAVQAHIGEIQAAQDKVRASAMVNLQAERSAAAKVAAERAAQLREESALQQKVYQERISQIQKEMAASTASVNALVSESTKAAELVTTEFGKSLKGFLADLDLAEEKEKDVAAAAKAARAEMSIGDLQGEADAELAAERAKRGTPMPEGPSPYSRRSGYDPRRDGPRPEGARSGGGGGNRGGGGGGGEDDEEEGAVSGLNRAFGRGSTLNRVVSGLAIAGFERVGSELDFFATKLTEINKLAKEQDTDWTDITRAIGESLPVVGQFYAAGSKIHDLLTGEQQQIDLLNTQAEAANRFAEIRLDLVRKTRDAHEETRRTIRGMNNEIAMAGLNPGAAQVLGIRQNIQSITEDAAADDKKRKEQQDADRAAAMKSLEELQKKEPVAGQPGLLDRAVRFLGGKETDAARKDREAAELSQRQEHEKQKTELLANHDKKDAAAQADADEKRKIALSVQANALAVIERDESIERLRAAQAIEKSIRDVRESANEETLRLAGRFHEADLNALQRNLSDENQAVKNALLDRVKIINQDFSSGKIGDDEADREMNRAKDEAARTTAANQAKYKVDVTKIDEADKERLFGRQEQVDNIRLAALNDQAAAGNKAAEVERDRLRIAEEFQKRQEEIRVLMLTANDAEKKTLEAESAQLDVAQKRAQAHAVDERLMESGVAGLQREAAAGDRIAAVELKRFENARAFRAEREKLNAIIASGDSSALQKAQAAALLARSADDEKRANAFAGLEGVKMNPFFNVQDNAGGGLTGLRERAQLAALNWNIRKHVARDPLVDPDAPDGIGPPAAGRPPKGAPGGGFDFFRGGKLVHASPYSTVGAHRAEPPTKADADKTNGLLATLVNRVATLVNRVEQLLQQRTPATDHFH